MDKTSSKLLKLISRRKNTFLPVEDISVITKCDNIYTNRYIAYLESKNLIEPVYSNADTNELGETCYNLLGYKTSVPGDAFISDSKRDYAYKGLLAAASVITAISTLGVLIYSLTNPI